MAKDIHEVHKILRTKEFYDLCVEYVGLPFHVEIIRKAEYLVKKKERKYAIK
jgi:hypothetical protein